MMFRDQVGVLAGWFKGWNECEQTVALLSLLKRVSRTQARFLQICLEHSLSDCTELHILEVEANDPAFINQWHQESKDKVIMLLLTHLPLLKPGNIDAKMEYMKLLPKILAHSIENNQHIEESRQLLSYALIHPATSLEDRNALAMWLNHLEDRTSGYGGQSRGRPDSMDYGQTLYHQRQNSDDKLNGWQNLRDSGICVSASNWPDKNPACENGHLPLYSSVSVPTTINTIGTSTTTILSGQTHHSPLKRSVSLTPPINVPNQPLGHGWMSHEDLRGRGPQCIPSDHAPLSPQSSVASSGSGGSEHLEDQPVSRNTFQEEGSGMKDVPAWLKSLRLHKYAALFSQLTYEEMMGLTEVQLEAQNVTKGARHKIVLSIQKLKERQNVLRSLEKDILEGGNLRNALQELHQMILTPIKAYNFPQTQNIDEQRQDLDSQSSLMSSDSSMGNRLSDGKDSATGGIQQHNVTGCEGESGAAPVPEGDLPGQFTRVMGKVCTQLLVSRPDEENISSYLQLIDKCVGHEAFTETQKKRMLSWKQQVQKLFRSFPRKSLLDMPGYRQQRNWSFNQSNSLPAAGSVGGGMVRRTQRQFQMPPRNLPTARLGLIGPSGLLGASQRSATNNPALLKQGRQNLWFANPGGSNSMPSRTHSSVQRTRSLPVHTSPQTMLMFQQPEFQVPVTEPDINNRLESLCLSMTEHALGDGVDRNSTI
ncbi:protein Smaug homolog 1 isoform X1 [Callorhinchus milii]|uniref:Protein Smaug homolog 1 n=1 Tax=Callorhinchus milii TaxID=7868 RepID=A0A4W3IA72_CALMI|nr:protein Smaug homolog 1 isoform X1 [Callorhinchus milii]XP_007886326.1 protein Smaug homolog 1 isoform X1 [Callorhinchus milii]XP_007886327.1 protein Smaug homolog 1 isoform X1 [Callorhinchus milii]XP_007886328.1 protein Smaug homolog 1 isoform X1 [Callorhinchus milii]XP_007886329.1 protein Smaug homolog 1 isoform X1 [Callorhinchus milii]|eukprot:gi/632942277/ref/XP_007886324.1/ PREDICTED: protein Smaug homolog 1 isoform X1 [Callorhinchus milii]